MSYLAHIIQKPHIKTAVCLALQSKQGGGKGIILKLMAAIIGDNHYSQNSNANHIFGDFNGLLEGKVLINLDEAFWGGDKKLEGNIKNKITEDKQSINKKNINHYNINDFCNYIISTNSDWFAGVEEGDRRYYCTQLSNKYSGRSTAETEAYYNPILAVSPEAFAKVLYNWDLTNFNPRKFGKTKLLQDQVERNWNSVKIWWNSVMKDGGFMVDDEFIEYNTLMKNKESYGKYIGGEYIVNKKKKLKMTAYHKDWIHSVYKAQCVSNAYEKVFGLSAFYRDFYKHCLESQPEQKIQKNGTRRFYLLLPDINIAREKWNELQEFNYEYNDDDADEWEIDNDCDISDDE